MSGYRSGAVAPVRARSVEPVERLGPRPLAESFEGGARPFRIADIDQLGLGMIEGLGHAADAIATAVATGRVGRRRYRPALMYGRVLGVAVLGVGGHLVTVEAHVGRGLPALIVTGLPGAGVQDARERVRPAVEGAKLEWPLRRVVVNLAPANVRKEGPGLDLPLVMSVLAATRQVPSDRLRAFAFAGEVSLKGELLTTPGILTVAIAAARAGLDGVVVPAANAVEAAQVEGLRVVGAETLSDVVGFLRGTWSAPDVTRSTDDAPAAASVDLSEVRGQTQARRALEVAAAGGHNMLMVGSPGAGKTMLARRLPTILPELSREESLEATQLHSVAGLLGASRGLLRARPFRAPHHSVSTVGTARRRQHVRAARGSESRASRRAVPRRAHGVPTRRRRGTAAAARGRPCRHHARRRLRGVPREVHPRRGRQPVSVRLRRRRHEAVRLQARPGPALPEQAVGTAARPDRHPFAHPAAHQGGAARLLAGRGVFEGASKGRGGARPTAHGDGRGWVCRATPICPGRSRAERVRCPRRPRAC